MLFNLHLSVPAVHRNQANEAKGYKT